MPFFFEPNWDAEIRPLEAAFKLQEELGQGATPPPKKAVMYGEFLTKKVNYSIPMPSLNCLLSKRVCAPDIVPSGCRQL